MYFTAAIAFLMMPIIASADWQLNMREGVTPLSKDIYELHMTIMGICALIGLVVWGSMAYILINHRKSKGAVPASFEKNLTLENIWTVIPFLILVAMAIPATLVLIDMDDFAHADLTVKITVKHPDLCGISRRCELGHIVGRNHVRQRHTVHIIFSTNSLIFRK